MNVQTRLQPTPQISIIVPTIGRVRLLRRLLDSLTAQNVDRSLFEVIVVDNHPGGADVETVACCNDSAYHQLRLRCVYESKPGASQARNSGISQAFSPLVGFVDDDEVLPNNWVMLALGIACQTRADLFGGPCFPYFLDPRPNWVRNEYMVLTAGSEARWLGPGEYLFGGNLVFRKDLLERLGGFNTSIGRIGENMEYGEETELQRRAEELGVQRWYDPELVILHYTPAHRMRLGWFFSSAWFHGKAKARLDLTRRSSDCRSKLRIWASGLRDVMPKAVRFLFSMVRAVLRDRNRHPFIENHLIEEGVPQFSGLSQSVHTTLLLLQGEKRA